MVMSHRTKQPTTGHAPGDWRLSVEPGDTFEWQVRPKLPLLAKLFIRQRYVEPYRRNLSGKKSARGPSIDEVGGYRPGLKPAQERAIAFLVENEAMVRAKVLRAVADHANELRSGGGWEEFENPPGIDAVMPRQMTADQAAERIKITRICATTKSRDGMAYLEVYGECAWDPDHGFEVVMHGDRLVGVYQQGTGWRDARPGKARPPKPTATKGKHGRGNPVV
jgi:hypothetical protein